MLERGKNERGVIEIVDTESLVPEGHLLRQVDGAVDFDKLKPAREIIRFPRRFIICLSPA